MHTIRSNLFDFQWNIKALVKANKLPPEAGQIGWLWLIDWLAEVTHGQDAASLPPVLRNWRRTDTAKPPITCRGVIRESMMQTDPTMIDPEALLAPSSKDKLKQLMQHHVALMDGDVVQLKRLTGIAVTPAQCQAIVSRNTEVAASKPVLEARGSKQLHQGLRRGPAVHIPAAHPVHVPELQEVAQPPAGVVVPPLHIPGPSQSVGQVVVPPQLAPSSEEEEPPDQAVTEEEPPVETAIEKRLRKQREKRRAEKEDGSRLAKKARQDRLDVDAKRKAAARKSSREAGPAAFKKRRAGEKAAERARKQPRGGEGPG